MKFNKVVNLILEESQLKPEFELITPEKYTNGYMENTKTGEGYLLKITKDSLLRIVRQVPSDIDEVKEIKEKWLKALVMEGYEIMPYLGAISSEERIKHDIKPDLALSYVVHNPEDVAYLLKDYNWIHWLEPVKTIKDYTSDDVADTFKDFIDEL
jgi:hypothetical protein